MCGWENREYQANARGKLGLAAKFHPGTRLTHLGTSDPSPGEALIRKTGRRKLEAERGKGKREAGEGNCADLSSLRSKRQVLQFPLALDLQHGRGTRLQALDGGFQVGHGSDRVAIQGIDHIAGLQAPLL